MVIYIKMLININYSQHKMKNYSHFSLNHLSRSCNFLGPGIPTFLEVKEANEFIQNLKRKNINLPPILILKYKESF